MSSAGIAAWRIERRDDTALLMLSGDGRFGGSGIRAVADLQRLRGEVGNCAVLRFDTSGMTRWDSALVAFVRALQTFGDGNRGRGLDLDLSGLPVPAQRLLALAAGDRGAGIGAGKPVHRSLVWRVR